MSVPITRIPLCIALCLTLPFFMGCEECKRYQDVASVELVGFSFSDADIDSVAMIANDSIISNPRLRNESTIGSETHCVKFPINVRIQLFKQGDLWKEFFLQMERNTVLKIYGSGCPNPLSKPKWFIDSSFTDDYCWILEKKSDFYGSENCVQSIQDDSNVDVTKCSI